jgi:hypothetical protein
MAIDDLCLYLNVNNYSILKSETEFNSNYLIYIRHIEKKEKKETVFLLDIWSDMFRPLLQRSVFVIIKSCDNNCLKLDKIFLLQNLANFEAERKVREAALLETKLQELQELLMGHRQHSYRSIH